MCLTCCVSVCRISTEGSSTLRDADCGGGAETPIPRSRAAFIYDGHLEERLAQVWRAGGYGDLGRSARRSLASLGRPYFGADNGKGKPTSDLARCPLGGYCNQLAMIDASAPNACPALASILALKSPERKAQDAKRPTRWGARGTPRCAAIRRRIHLYPSGSLCSVRGLPD